MLKKISLRILLIFFMGIWLISAAFSVFSNSEKSSYSIRFEDKKPAFHLVYNESNPSNNPKISSKAAILVDLEDGSVILHKDENEKRSIASLTKLATAIVFLDTYPDLVKVETVIKDDREGAGRSRLWVGEKLAIYDLFNLMLICSDNVAARVIARSTGLGKEEFVARMNETALKLNLLNTKFADPTGLDPNNVSTAADCARLFKAALEHDLVVDAISKKNHTFRALNGHRQYTIYNTNRMLFGRNEVIGGKTGYIKESGYCLAVGVEDLDGRKLAAVVLGAPTSGYRFRDAARLVACIDKL